MAEHYAAAGVSLEAGYKSVELIKEHVKKTMRPEVLGGLGGFSGAFSLSKIKDMEEPVLLSGTDGCGTKVKLAMVMNKHDTIGIDAVARTFQKKLQILLKVFLRVVYNLKPL